MEPSTTQVVFTTLKGISLQVNFLQGLVHLKGANIADEGRDVVGQQLYGIMQCLIFGGGDLTRACKSSLGKLETPVEVAWRYNRTDLFPLFAARGIEIPSGRPPQDLMESFISGMPTS